MTGAPRPSEKRSPTVLVPEGFRVAASAELQKAAPWVPGRCFNPGCGKAFEARRPGQIYCSRACMKAGAQEMRTWGNRMALPALVWRQLRYSQDLAELTLVRAARRHITRVQSAWLQDREGRAQ